MARSLQDMVVIITGASAGIGRALAEELSAAGARLALAARRVDRLEQLNRQLQARHLVIPADVATTAACREIVERTLSAFDRIDTVVANAGFGIYKDVAGTTPREMRSVFETNVFGTTDLIFAALPAMRHQEPRDGWRGQVMIVSSCVARRGVPLLGAYSATKAAQLGIAEALRVELKRDAVAVTSVHPIQTRTEFGDVARARGGVTIAPSPVGQTVQTVARRMVTAIRRPRPEVWPSRPSRWAFGLGTLFPRLVDRAMLRYYRQTTAATDQRRSGI